MKKEKFKKDDWCFCEFKLQQIIDTKGDRVTAVSDGSFQMSGNDLSDRCFPLDMKIKRVSDTVAYWSNRIHELKYNSLNHPDLNRELIRRWAEMCENIDNKEVLQSLYDSLDKFGQAVSTKVRDLRFEELEGVRLFTR